VANISREFTSNITRATAHIEDTPGRLWQKIRQNSKDSFWIGRTVTIGGYDTAILKRLCVFRSVLRWLVDHVIGNSYSNKLY
jgi:hypothetical protein